MIMDHNKWWQRWDTDLHMLSSWWHQLQDKSLTKEAREAENAEIDNHDDEVIFNLEDVDNQTEFQNLVAEFAEFRDMFKIDINTGDTEI